MTNSSGQRDQSKSDCAETSSIHSAKEIIISRKDTFPQANFHGGLTLLARAQIYCMIVVFVQYITVWVSAGVARSQEPPSLRRQLALT